MTVRIVCINKAGGHHDEPHEAINRYGWVDDANSNNKGRTNRSQMVEFIEEGNSAYVTDGINKAFCRVRQNKYGTKFLQTVSDGKWSDNLLRLPECS
jgi:hypothetical protein